MCIIVEFLHDKCFCKVDNAPFKDRKGDTQYFFFLQINAIVFYLQSTGNLFLYLILTIEEWLWMLN